MLSLLFSAWFLQPNISEVGGDFVYDHGIGVQGIPWLFMAPQPARIKIGPTTESSFCNLTEKSCTEKQKCSVR